MESWIIIYLIGCLVVLMLTSTIVDIHLDITNGESPNHWLNDFIMSSVKFGAILLSWYTLVVYLIISINKLLDNLKTPNNE